MTGIRYQDNNNATATINSLLGSEGSGKTVIMSGLRYQDNNNATATFNRLLGSEGSGKTVIMTAKLQRYSKH